MKTQKSQWTVSDEMIAEYDNSIVVCFLSFLAIAVISVFVIIVH